jgi:integrase/recombinase XerD
MTELRRRMLEELRLRNYSPNTIEVYLRGVANFAHHFRVSPDRLGPEHVREYQLFLVERKKVSWAVSTKRYAHYVFSITTPCTATG